jgi:hypothetical protein
MAHPIAQATFATPARIRAIINKDGGDGGGGATTSGTRTPLATLTGVTLTTFTWVPVAADS